MVKSMYNYIRDAWKNPEKSYVGDLFWERLQVWRREPTIVKLERPTRLDRARVLGYKAKQGIVVARTKVRRGGSRKSRYIRGRKSKHMGLRTLTRRKSLQRIAEERVSRKFRNMEVLNSYWVGEDGKHKWYEVILVDPHHPSIIADKNLCWISKGTNRGRAERGLTSAGKKGRGMRKKGMGTEKTRPSLGSHDRRGK
jgi:large subunit ribosomal protein L15e